MKLTANPTSILAESPLLQTIFKQSPVGYLVLSPKGEIVLSNPKFQQLVGYQEEEIAERNVSHLIFPEERPKIGGWLAKAGIQKDPEARVTWENRYLQKEGGYFWARTTLFYLTETDGSTYFAAMVEDLSGKEKAQKKVDESLADNFELKVMLEKAEFCLENTHVGIAWVTKDSRVVYSNKAYADMVGIDKSQLIGMRIIDYRDYVTEEGWKKHWEKVSKKKHLVMELDFVPNNPRGKSIPVELSITQQKFNDIPYNIIFFRDITLRKKHIKKVEQQKREMEQFAYAASHDLQGPLKTIINYIGLIKGEFKEKWGEDAHKFLEVVSNSANRMKVLTNHLLDYSRLGQKREKSWIDFTEMLRNLQVDLQSTIQETQTKLEIGPMPHLEGYNTELRLLFQNLIMNAIKFRKKALSPVIRIQASEELDYWVFSVADNGIGIDPKYQDRIFKIFQRLHTQKEYEGTGIGLAHCQKIAELHDGTIWIESQLDKGSTFFVKIHK